MTSPSDTAPSSGVLKEIRHAAESLLGLARTRVELFGVELQEEKLRLIRLLLWLALGASLLLAGILVAVGTLGLFLWENAGYPGLILLAAVTLALGTALLWMLRRHVRTSTLPFAETAAEFGRDVASLRKE